jgi:hypothetical protein
MRSWYFAPARLPAFVLGGALLAAGLPTAGQAQVYHDPPPGYCPASPVLPPAPPPAPPAGHVPGAPSCPYPLVPTVPQPQPQVPTPPSTERPSRPSTEPSTQTEEQRRQQQQQAQTQQQQNQPNEQEPSANTGQEAATAAESFASPNMVGHLLFGSRTITFNYNRAAGPINVASPGSTSFTNPAVADDESPIPRDRFSFRFNYYNDANRVTGFGPAVFSTVNGQSVGTAGPVTRKFDAEDYTFYFEKTFLDGNASVELRVPFNTGLSNNLNLSAGTITGNVAPGVFSVASTPESTLGDYGTQFGNMTVLLKAMGYSCKTLSITAGLALEMPTGDNNSVNVIDYSGSTVQGVATIQRDRLIKVDNETWSLSPFLAYVSTPNEHFFNQGFIQLDVPLNSSTVNYTNTFLRGSAPPLPGVLRMFPTLNPPFTVKDHVAEQTLLQLDWGAGYWLMRDPNRCWLTGIAPTIELHYTTTLDHAQVVQLPSDNLLRLNPADPTRLIQEQGPRVGNTRDQVTILDMTTAVTWLIADKATVATGFAFPLLEGKDRTFDWEFQLQLNYYFGGGFSRRPVPNF